MAKEGYKLLVATVEAAAEAAAIEAAAAAEGAEAGAAAVAGFFLQSGDR